jgi:hypothetical protein
MLLSRAARFGWGNCGTEVLVSGKIERKDDKEEKHDGRNSKRKFPKKIHVKINARNSVILLL